ncbi:MAG TPA: hypothetical protein PKJ85_05725 [Nitrosomonas nitrosa]|nr:hypothetical protein [Nitrosomonas sp.]HNP51281.1 hypothetical protein [Nitrosomonas nitrosa]
MANVNALSRLWNNSWLHKFAATVAFIFLAWAHYQFAHLVISKNIEYCDSCSPLITAPNEKLFIGDIVSRAENQILFLYTGEFNQAINIHFDKARLDEKTYQHLSYFLQDIPITPQPIDFNAIQNKLNKTNIKIILRNPTTVRNAIYLSRELTSEIDRPDFRISFEKLDIAVEINPVFSNENEITTDGSDLKIGNWRYKLTGIPITIIPENNTSIVFRFLSADWNSAQLFEPFFITGPSVIGNDNMILAQAVGTVASTKNKTINSLLCGTSESNEILFLGGKNLINGICPNNEQLSLLQLTSFNIGKEHVQIAVDGSAWIQIDGEPITVDLVALIKENPYLAALLAAFDAMMLTWIKRAFGTRPRVAETK